MTIPPLSRRSVLGGAAALTVAPAQAMPRVDASTLAGKMIFGFQGWFGYPSDGGALDRWNHWFRNNRATPADATVDLLPDVSWLPPSERYDTGMRARDGDEVEVFSDQHADTVLRQFQLMRKFGLEGVALQRFVISLGDDARHPFADRVLDNVRAAAEATGRVFFIEYDIAQAQPDNWPERILTDWLSLLRDRRIAESPAYLHHRGRPLFGITGPGGKGEPATPAQTLKLLGDLRTASQPYGGATLFGTVPWKWLTMDPYWLRVFTSYDVISPWLVGAFRTDDDIAYYIQHVLNPDLAATRRLGKDLMPVVFPGFSWANLKEDPSQKNKIPRRGGEFLWRQATAFTAAGAQMLFGAMFDEVDEGTAFFPVLNHTSELPAEGSYVALDADGFELPTDWYLRIAGQITRLVAGKSAKFPPPG